MAEEVPPAWAVALMEGIRKNAEDIRKMQETSPAWAVAMMEDIRQMNERVSKVCERMDKLEETVHKLQEDVRVLREETTASLMDHKEAIVSILNTTYVRPRYPPSVLFLSCAMECRNGY